MSAALRTNLLFPFILGLATVVSIAPGVAAQEKPAAVPATKAVSAEVAADPLLKAMREELDRSKSQLKMDNVAAPYYIEYRIADVQAGTAETAFGSLRQDQSIHARNARVVGRVGDYKLDSYYGPGLGVGDYAPLDSDPVAIRRELWLATDS